MSDLKEHLPYDRPLDESFRQTMTTFLVAEARKSASEFPDSRSYFGLRVSRLSMAGRTLITTGMLMLMLIGYQLLGTGAITNREQTSLGATLQSQWTSELSGTVPRAGEAMARIGIPGIDAEWIVVEGVGTEHLKKGPGHYPGTALPGEHGNVVISGHRTTYGGPFGRLDELSPGDEIVVSTESGPHKYLVSESKVVNPTAMEVIGDYSDARLTLITCHPRFSAKQRLVVVALLADTRSD